MYIICERVHTGESLRRADIAATLVHGMEPTLKNMADRIEKLPGDRPRIKRAQGFVDEVFELIRADIMSLKIPPDTRILIGRLVKELGVSQTPIREALSMLGGARPRHKEAVRRYCTAPKLTRKQFDELYEIRLLLEPYAAKCAAERMDDAEIKEIGELAKRMRPGESESRASYGKFADDDSELHERIARGSKNFLIEESLARPSYPPAHLSPAL